MVSEYRMRPLVGHPNIVRLAENIRDTALEYEITPVFQEFLDFDVEGLSERTGLSYDLCGMVYTAAIMPVLDEVQSLITRTDAEWWLEHRETAHVPLHRIADDVRLSVPCIIADLEKEAKAGLTDLDNRVIQ